MCVYVLCVYVSMHVCGCMCAYMLCMYVSAWGVHVEAQIDVSNHYGSQPILHFTYFVSQNQTQT